MDAEEQEEYQQLLLKHKQELEDFERHFNAQIASANPSLKKKLNQRFPKEKNALEERQYEELLPYKLSGLLTCSDTTTTTTTTTTTHNKSNNSHHNNHNSNNNSNSNNSSSNSSKEEQAKQKKREKNKKKADSKKKKQDEMRKQVQDEFEREGGVTMRMKELQAILNQLNPLHLTIHEIESDGHCLYRAVCHQLLLLQSTASKMVNHVENDGQNENGEHGDDGHDNEHVMIEEKTKTTTMNHLQLRKLVANYLRENKNDFIYFMETEDGDIMDDAQYENYCKTVESSSEWGGQIELRAIAFILQKPIRIFQQGQQPILMGEEFVDPSDPEQGVLSVSYHRSYYSLGEHYNSIIETPKEEEPL